MFSHGLPHHPTALAYDVLQSLVAIGNDKGTIRIYPLTILLYRISGIIGESNIWRFALKMQLARFLFGVFDHCMDRNPCLQPKWCTFNLAIFT